MKQWLTVLEAPVEVANRAYAGWLATWAIDPGAIDDRDLRVDTIHTSSGDLRRYRLRHDIASSLGVGPISSGE
jgi:hypothetical protein